MAPNSPPRRPAGKPPRLSVRSRELSLEERRLIHYRTASMRASTSRGPFPTRTRLTWERPATTQLSSPQPDEPAELVAPEDLQREHVPIEGGVDGGGNDHVRPTMSAPEAPVSSLGLPDRPDSPASVYYSASSDLGSPISVPQSLFPSEHEVNLTTSYETWKNALNLRNFREVTYRRALAAYEQALLDEAAEFAAYTDVRCQNTQSRPSQENDV